jgi:amino acid adenylation domain-containing protein
MDALNRREALSDAKRALLEKRRAGLAHAPRRREVITRCAGPGPEHPASYMQEQMWLAVQLDPTLPVYNVPVATLVRADADVGALERAFGEVVRRHEGLRTVFRVVNGELRQVVLPPHPVKADVRDLRGEVGGDFEAGVRRIVSAEGAKPLSVERGPLVRMAFLRVSDERAALVITIHHIVTDGWAYPLILHELWELYAAYRHGRTLALPEPALRYADYAVWQREHLMGETLERHVGWWRNLLHGAPETELVGDRPRPAASSYRGAFTHFVFPDRTHAALRAVCRREAATLNMALSAAFAATVARYTGSGDVVFGALFGNRSRPELEQVVGCFVNSAALRLDLTDDPSFAEAVRRARRLVLDADAHQELPFEKVVEHLRLERDPSRNPLFQLMYFHHTFVPSHSQQAAEAELDPQPVYRGEASLVDTSVAKLDLTIATLEEGDRLSAVVEYATDLFDAPTIERFCRHFTTLAARAAAEPDRPLSQFSLLDDEESRAVLHDWSRGEPSSTEPAPLHRLFEAQAARKPDAEAIRFAGRAATFAELDAQASRIGRRLRALGVGPEAVVALLLDRSPHVIAAMLGVSKAGGAFLPIDPTTPPERIRFMLADAGAAVVITETALADDLPSDLPRLLVERLLVDSADEGAEAELPADDGDVDGAAYVIYTSGSTGTPKGVVVTHRGIASLARMERDVLGIEPGVRVLQFASFAFDASLWDVFTLLSGATLVLAPRGDAAGGETLDALLTRERVNVATLPPSVLASLPADALPDLRTVVSTGEAVSADVVRRWRRDGRHFVNGYGPTETTVGATLAVDPEPAGRISIGRPFPGTRVYLLDERLDPVPPGVPGEVYVGGPALARGYLGRPGLTAERFVPDAHSGTPGARLYRTGDVARWRGDGELEFVGRADRQVKLRGFRIELGEVEDALLGAAGVREAAVVVREDSPGVRRLVAYAVAGQDVSPDGLRTALRERLPEYMVPSAFVFLPELPRTPSGKPDRRALPAPDTSAGAAAHVPPRDDAEAALARAWSRVLGREEIGMHDNFFELGGDSILAIQVIARAAESGIRLQPWQMFRFQTIAEQALAARADAPSDRESASAKAPDDAAYGDGLDDLDASVLDAVLGQLGLE